MPEKKIFGTRGLTFTLLLSLFLFNAGGITILCNANARGMQLDVGSGLALGILEICFCASLMALWNNTKNSEGVKKALKEKVEKLTYEIEKVQYEIEQLNRELIAARVNSNTNEEEILMLEEQIRKFRRRLQELTNTNFISEDDRRSIAVLSMKSCEENEHYASRRTLFNYADDELNSSVHRKEQKESNIPTTSDAYHHGNNHVPYLATNNLNVMPTAPQLYPENNVASTSSAQLTNPLNPFLPRSSELP